MTRECLGCGGTGNGGDITYSLSRFVEYPDGSLAYVPGEPYMNPCLACQGSGQVEDDSTSNQDSASAPGLRGEE